MTIRVGDESAEEIRQARKRLARRMQQAHEERHAFGPFDVSVRHDHGPWTLQRGELAQAPSFTTIGKTTDIVQ